MSEQPAPQKRRCPGRTLYLESEVTTDKPIAVAYVLREASGCSDKECESILCEIIFEDETLAWFKHYHTSKGSRTQVIRKPDMPCRVTFVIDTREADEPTTPDRSSARKPLTRFGRSKN